MHRWPSTLCLSQLFSHSTPFPCFCSYAYTIPNRLYFPKFNTCCLIFQGCLPGEPPSPPPAPSALVSPVNIHTSFSQPSAQCLLLRAFPALYSCSRSYCFHRFLVSAWLAPEHSLILSRWLKLFSWSASLPSWFCDLPNTKDGVWLTPVLREYQTLGLWMDEWMSAQEVDSMVNYDHQQ